MHMTWDYIYLVLDCMVSEKWMKAHTGITIIKLALKYSEKCFSDVFPLHAELVLFYSILHVALGTLREVW